MFPPLLDIRTFLFTYLPLPQFRPHTSSVHPAKTETVSSALHGLQRKSTEEAADIPTDRHSSPLCKLRKEMHCLFQQHDVPIYQKQGCYDRSPIIHIFIRSLRKGVMDKTVSFPVIVLYGTVEVSYNLSSGTVSTVRSAFNGFLAR